MAVLKIEPVELKTRGGFDAIVNGYHLGSTDYLSGTVTIVTGKKSVIWNGHGLCRDNSAELNLDPHSNEFQDLVRGAEALGVARD